MRKGEWITIGLAVATFLGTLILASMWLGSLSSRVDRLENQIGELRMGPRGENCQQIVGKLVERPTDQALKQLASEWGCSWMPAVQAIEQADPKAQSATRTCSDGTVVLRTEECPAAGSGR